MFVDIACEDGAAVTNLFLDAGYSPDSENSLGLRPLHCAAQRGELELVERLIDLGAEVNVATWDPAFMPIHYAAMRGELEVIQSLVAGGAHVNAPSPRGTAMLIALQTLPADWTTAQGPGSVPAPYTVLIGIGADPTAADPSGGTLLHYAAGRSNQAFVEALLDRGLDVNARDRKGETPLAVAMQHFVVDGAANRTFSAGLIRRLIAAGADVDVRDADGRPIVFRTAQRPDLFAIFADAGADFNATGIRCETFWESLLNLAWGYMPESAYTQVFAIADDVEQIDAAPSAGDQACDNALHTAARTSDPRLVAYFLGRGLSARATGKNGETPLHGLLARVPLDRRPQDPALEAVELLLRAGADVNARDGSGRTPLMAADRRPAEFAELLIRNGAEPGTR
jgi:ankyrin repeat protein